jgi:acyl dehydratase
MTTLSDIGGLRESIGKEIAVSDWIVVTQERIDQFADATGDHQWIHVDPARAEAESPYKTTIAHGFLTLSLASALLRNAVSFPPLRLAVNYGCDRVRFVSPVPAGARLRGRFTPKAIEQLRDGWQVTWTIAIERDGGARPACVVEWLVRYHP